MPFGTVIRYTLKLFTAGHIGPGAHSLHVKFTQWNPVPIKFIVSEFAGATPFTVKVAVRFPPCAGVKLTFTVQVESAPIIPPQEFVCPNSLGAAPPKLSVNVTLAEELFVIVKGTAVLVCVMSVPANVQERGEPEQAADVVLAFSTGVMLNIPITEVVPVVAVTVTGVELFTDPVVVRGNIPEDVPAVTEVGELTGAIAGSLLERFTESPPAGDVPLSVIVPVVVPPAATFAGLNESDWTKGGSTVRPPPTAVPLGMGVAVTVTGVLAATGEVVTLNVLLVAPAATVKGLGTGIGVTTPDGLVVRLKLIPPAGAGPFRVTVAMEAFPPVTELGPNVNAEIAGGLTVNWPLWTLLPTVAITVSTSGVATLTVDFAVKVWLV